MEKGIMWARVVSILLAVVVPGGFLVLVAFMLARAVHTHMEADTGPQRLRLGRALSAVRWSDVVQQARHVL
jgi:hypothetical protein